MVKDLDQALAEIAEIRTQMARTVVFGGYGPFTVAATGVLALVAAGLQGVCVERPTAFPANYLMLWCTTAIVCIGIVGVEMSARARRVHGDLGQEMLTTAVEQFVPAIAAGGLVTMTLLAYAPETIWMLPGLWQVCFSLGVF